MRFAAACALRCERALSDAYFYFPDLAKQKGVLIMSVQSEKKLAVLIDADNISASLAGDIFKKAYAIGTPIARRQIDSKTGAVKVVKA